MPMRRVFISDDDLALIEQACRSLAVQYSIDAERQKNPVVSDGAAETARNAHLAYWCSGPMARARGESRAPRQVRPT